MTNDNTANTRMGHHRMIDLLALDDPDFDLEAGFDDLPGLRNPLNDDPAFSWLPHPSRLRRHFAASQRARTNSWPTKARFTKQTPSLLAGPPDRFRRTPGTRR
ncbi:MAG: hypothetical protein R2839_00280 [Thermomicrobiales bacterium]